MFVPSLKSKCNCSSGNANQDLLKGKKKSRSQIALAKIFFSCIVINAQKSL